MSDRRTKADKQKEEAYLFSVATKSEAVKQQNGVVLVRGCTDCLCLLIFLAYLALMVVISFKGFINGNVYKLLAPLDRNHNFCGYGTNRDYPNLYMAYG